MRQPEIYSTLQDYSHEKDLSYVRRRKVQRHVTAQDDHAQSTFNSVCVVFRVYEEVLIVTGHWIDNDWNLKSIIIEFARFRTPHTGRAAKAFLRD